MGRKGNAVALYLEGIRDGRAREAVAKYTGDRYTQHSMGVRDGIEDGRIVEHWETAEAIGPEDEWVNSSKF